MFHLQTSLRLGKATFIITGKKGEGKTTKIEELVNLLTLEKISVNGVIAKALFVEGERNSYQAKVIADNTPEVLCTAIPTANFEQIGHFYFNSQLIKKTEDQLNKIKKDNIVFVIDEIGPMELKGKVWSKLLNNVLSMENYTLLLSIREPLLNEIILHFNLMNTFVFNTNDDNLNIINTISKTYNIK